MDEAIGDSNELENNVSLSKTLQYYYTQILPHQ